MIYSFRIILRHYERPRHCEERSDAAIQKIPGTLPFVYAKASARQVGVGRHDEGAVIVKASHSSSRTSLGDMVIQKGFSWIAASLRSSQ